MGVHPALGLNPVPVCFRGAAGWGRIPWQYRADEPERARHCRRSSEDRRTGPACSVASSTGRFPAGPETPTTAHPGFVNHMAWARAAPALAWIQARGLPAPPRNAPIQAREPRWPVRFAMRGPAGRGDLRRSRCPRAAAKGMMTAAGVAAVGAKWVCVHQSTRVLMGSYVPTQVIGGQRHIRVLQP